MGTVFEKSALVGERPPIINKLGKRASLPQRRVVKTFLEDT